MQLVSQPTDSLNTIHPFIHSYVHVHQRFNRQRRGIHFRSITFYHFISFFTVSPCAFRYSNFIIYLVLRTLFSIGVKIFGTRFFYQVYRYNDRGQSLSFAFIEKQICAASTNVGADEMLRCSFRSWFFFLTRRILKHARC